MPPVRYRRVPEEVEAFLYNEDNAEEIMEWAAGKRMRWDAMKARREAPIWGDEEELHIFEGVKKDRRTVDIAHPGDFIVKTSLGFKAVPANEFRATYQPI